jgi:hypothetical protein
MVHAIRDRIIILARRFTFLTIRGRWDHVLRGEGRGPHQGQLPSLPRREQNVGGAIWKIALLPPLPTSKSEVCSVLTIFIDLLNYYQPLCLDGCH